MTKRIPSTFEREMKNPAFNKAFKESYEKLTFSELKQKIYFIKDIEKIIGRDRLTLRRWWNKNIFPKPSLINNRLAWQAEIIEQWIRRI